jgi:hypothetical protein
MSPLRAEEMFACLDRHGVRYVLIGGLAAVLHGSPLQTLDVDICPDREGGNLERLADALREMDARLRTADAENGVPFPREAAFLANQQLLNLVTRYGDLDLAFEPAGTLGFGELASRAEPVTIQGTAIQLARLEDVIRSKEAANRPKDLRALPLLRLLLQEIEKRRR